MSKIYFVSAGPGAADLITVRGMQILQQAQIVFYDALVGDGVLQYCSQAVLQPVGKRCGQHSWRQSAINQALVEASAHYDVIVRLKGGDAMVFGRVFEEIKSLRMAGIDFEIIPGVTSALAASAFLAQPLTIRGVSRRVLLATHAQAKEGSNDQTHEGQTDVYYMGRNQLIDIAQQLLKDAGSIHDVNTPATLVFAVSSPDASSISTTLGQIAAGGVTLTDRQNSQPCLLMVGRVFAL